MKRATLTGLLVLLYAGTAAGQPACPPVLSLKPEVRGLYVSSAHTIIGNPGQENALFGFALANDFNYLILYGVKTLLTSPSNPANPAYALQRQQLGSFIRKAHEFYGLEVGINVSSQSAAAPILEFLDWPMVVFDPWMRYDALHYEAEYWNGVVSFATWADTLSWLRDRCDERELLCEVYLGNPSHDTGPNAPNAQGQAEVDLAASLADRIQVTYYRDDPHTPSPNLFLDRLWRLHYLANTVDPSRIVVLLNGRPSGEPNMHAWLNAQTGPWADRLAEPFRVWNTCPHGYLDNVANDTDALGLPLADIEVLGYSWYRYQSIRPPAFDVRRPVQFRGPGFTPPGWNRPGHPRNPERRQRERDGRGR